ncbi:MAG: hypothetical protein ACREJ2_13265 [Planctomycetota bacterium]
MKYFGAVLVWLGWCATLAAGEAVVRAEPFPDRPPLPARRRVAHRAFPSLDAWALALQDDFFRLQVEDRTKAVGAYMSARQFTAAVQPVSLAPEAPAPAVGDIGAPAFVPHLPAALLPGGLPALSNVPDFADLLQGGLPGSTATPPTFSLDTPFALQNLSRLADRLNQSAAADQQRLLQFQVPALNAQSGLNTLASRLTAGLNSFQLDTRLPALQTRADAGIDRTVDRLTAWLQSPAADPAALQRLETRLPNLPLESLRTDLLARLPAVTGQLHGLTGDLAGALQSAATAGQGAAAAQQLQSALQDVNSLASQLDQAAGQLSAGGLNLTAAADRLDPSGHLAAWLAAPGGLPALTTLTTLPAVPNLPTLTGLPGSPGLSSLPGLPGLSGLPSLSGATDPAGPSGTSPASLLGGLKLPQLDSATLTAATQKLSQALSTANLQLGSLNASTSAADLEQLDFRFGGNSLTIGSAAFAQLPNSLGGRDSLLAIGPTDLTLASGDFARFQNLSFDLTTASNGFQAFGSVGGLNLNFGRRQFSFDAGAFSLSATGSGAQLQAVLYPHDNRYGSGVGPNPAGIYFAINTQNSRWMSLWQNLSANLNAAAGALNGGATPSAAATSAELNGLINLIVAQPGASFGQDYLVVFSGRAAQMLQAQAGIHLDAGTRLLVDALGAFDGGYRTFAVTGTQVARLTSLAQAHRYSDMVEVARGIVPEIDVLYSHYLRRFGGRPDSLAAPLSLWQAGPLGLNLGASQGDYTTQWFGGLSLQLPAPTQSAFRQRLYAGWLYEQSGRLLDDARAAADLPPGCIGWTPQDFTLPGDLVTQYNVEGAGFLQYRMNGWAMEYESTYDPTLDIDPGTRLRWNNTLDLGVRQADYLSFAQENQFARPREFLARYDQPSPIGDLFPIFHAETALQYELDGLGRRSFAGIGCDADFGYGAVARHLGLQLPLAPELTPKAFLTVQRPLYTFQMLAAWPTAVDQVPYAACQFAWNLDRLAAAW